MAEDRVGLLVVGGVPLVTAAGDYIGAPDTTEGLLPPFAAAQFLRAGELEYIGLIRGLLPRGRAWHGRNLLRLAAGIARGFARIHAAIATFLIRECDPRTTEDLLPEWERAFGLPDPCVSDDELTIQRRHEVLVSKVAMRGGQSVTYLNRLAQSIGFDVEIEEFDMLTCVDPCDGAVYGERWLSAFSVHSAEVTIYEATCTDTCDVALRIWGNKRLECVLDRAKPAHTVAIYAYE